MVFRLQGWLVVRHLLAVLLIAFFVLVATAAVLFLGLDLAYADHVFKGVSVEGVYIGGLSKAEAVEKLRSELDMEALNRDLVLEFDGHTWPLALYEIDAYVDLESTVEKAMAAGRDMPFYQRWAYRAVFKGVEREVRLVVHYDRRKLESFVTSLERAINRPAVDAEIRLEGKRLVIQRSQEGWVLDDERARESILAALPSTERVVRLEIEVTPPGVSDGQVGKVIVVDKTNHLLTLYSNLEVEKKYPVAVGTPSWPTPSGTYKVVSMQRNPSWINPGTSWAATMPPYIPPGPGNPLGTRAIGTSAPGVFIHGTYNSRSIGTSASHGCIRMYIKDSEDLFERVTVGIPVLIF